MFSDVEAACGVGSLELVVDEDEIDGAEPSESVSREDWPLFWGWRRSGPWAYASSRDARER